MVKLSIFGYIKVNKLSHKTHFQSIEWKIDSNVLLMHLRHINVYAFVNDFDQLETSFGNSLMAMKKTH